MEVSKVMGYNPQIIHVNWIYHEINHPSIGVAPFYIRNPYRSYKSSIYIRNPYRSYRSYVFCFKIQRISSRASRVNDSQEALAFCQESEDLGLRDLVGVPVKDVEVVAEKMVCIPVKM